MKLTMLTRELVHIPGGILRQKRLLHAANSAAAMLFAAEGETFERSLREAMETIARGINADRIYIWCNSIRRDHLHYINEFSWTNDTGKHEKSVMPKAGYSYYESIPQWEEKFQGGECVNGPLHSLSPAEQERLGPFGIRSILVIPVYLRYRFWGFVSFEDCHSERCFTENEVNVLRSVSLMISSAMLRSEAVGHMREADERAKLMLDSVPLCCTLWNKNFKAIDCNEAAVTFFGLGSKQEYLGRFAELSPEYQPDGSLSEEKRVKYIAEAFHCGRLVFEWMHRKPDGSPVPSEVTLVRVASGDEHTVVGYARDLREHKKIIGEIERKNALLHTVNSVASILLHNETGDFESKLLRCMGMMAGHVGADRVYIWQNCKKNGRLYGTQLYEWSENAQPQQGCENTVDILYSEKAPGWQEKLSSGQCINGVVSDMSLAERAQLSPQGILSILVVPIFLQDAFWGFMGFDDCHRERRFSENEESTLRCGSLLIANAILSNEMNRRMRGAVAGAQAASVAKSNLISSISQAIRTPMNAIIGMTIIGKSASGIEKKDYAFGQIESASCHLLSVANDILDMAKIEDDKLELANVAFNFEKMLQRVINVMVLIIHEKQQSLTVHIDKDIPQTLVGDDHRLEQVIANLISNAVKFTPEKGLIRINASLVKEQDGFCIIQVDVTDTGAGISAERQARMLRPFEYPVAEPARKFGSTGLGFAISKHIIDMMGGNIRIQSEPGKGTKISFTVKLRRE